MSDFSTAVVRWQKAHGRHGLPWQADADPYKIWLSEIMLQQTQVATVIPYFLRFLRRFPNVQALARAREATVLAEWSGLGYYTRARNLHAAAKRMAQDGMPQTAEQWQTLPGVGKSTAAAIAVFSCGERRAILDGNVKRVLARAFQFPRPVNAPAAQAALWQIAEMLLPPARHIVPYTQGMMDIGAMLCLRAKPLCQQCPLAPHCLARQNNAQANYPVRAPAKSKPQKTARFVWLQDGRGRVLLKKMPAKGIWGGLWSLPDYAADDWRQAIDGKTDAAADDAELHFTHEFTHYKLLASVSVRHCTASSQTPAPPLRWHHYSRIPRLGLPAPIRRLLGA